MEDKKEKKLGVADSFVGATGQNNVIKVMKMPFSVLYKCCAARHVTKKEMKSYQKLGREYIRGHLLLITKVLV
jgi:hypothetical protein